MEEDLRLQKAIEFATKKHEGQFRKGGLPYISHPLAVAELIKRKGFDIDYQITALFHDLLEDTDATEEEILSIGGKDVLDAVKLLTKPKDYVMESYVSAIRRNPIAYAVKAADRLHNLRSAVITDEKFKRKYIFESVEWYLDFDEEIPKAINDIINTMNAPKEYEDILKDGLNKIENKIKTRKDNTMKIEKKLENEKLTIALEGRLDTTTAPELEKEVENSLSSVKDLIFDFAKLEYISSAGLRVILKAQKIMNQQGSMRLVNVSDEIMEVFDITGFVDILTID